MSDDDDTKEFEEDLYQEWKEEAKEQSEEQAKEAERDAWIEREREKSYDDDGNLRIYANYFNSAEDHRYLRRKDVRVSRSLRRVKNVGFT